MYPDVFNENIEVIAVDSLRTFFEKLTILHREANRVKEIIQRDTPDIFMMCIKCC